MADGILKFGVNEDGSVREKPVLCRNCEFSEFMDGSPTSCWHPAVLSTDLISGETPSDCRRERDGSGQCGLEGKLFKQHVPGPLAQAIGDFISKLVA